MLMEASGTSSPGSSSGNYGVHLSASNLLRSPLSTLLEYFGFLRAPSCNSESDNFISSGTAVTYRDQFQPRLDDSGASQTAAGGSGEVSIRIIAATEQEHDRVGAAAAPVREVGGQNEVFLQPISRTGSAVSVGSVLEGLSDLGRDRGTGEVASQAGSGSTDMRTTDGVRSNNRDSSYQRYGIQQAARLIEQVLPFTLLLLVVFIRQHLQGFFVTILLSAVMFKSNDIVKKQTALKGERKISVLASISLLFTVHVIGIYWWYWQDDLLYPLLMLPPKTIPPFGMPSL